MISSSNPFSTRFIRPGAISFQFPTGEHAENLISRLAANGWRGQITGPHGSGKSTLLANLIEQLERRDYPSWLICLRDGQRRMPSDWIEKVCCARARLVIVDGYEQLGLWSRCSLKFRCRQHGWGLLVTAHRDVGFPKLFETDVSLQLAQAIVAELLHDTPTAIGHAVIADAFAASGGNLRDMLFALYDQFEMLRGHLPATTAADASWNTQVSKSSDSTDCAG